MRKPRLSPEQVQEARELRERKVSVQDIARQFSVYPIVVYDALNRIGAYKDQAYAPAQRHKLAC